MVSGAGEGGASYYAYSVAFSSFSLNTTTVPTAAISKKWAKSKNLLEELRKAIR